jgi:site-specific recombinase XerD
MRHGGCRRVYNEGGGDLAVAQQLLGNSDLKSTLVYAKRSASALTEVAEKQWREKENTLETGDKW